MSLVSLVATSKIINNDDDDDDDDDFACESSVYIIPATSG